MMFQDLTIRLVIVYAMPEEAKQQADELSVRFGRLADEEAHAYRIMKEVADRTDGTVSVGPGSLHFALSKLLKAEMITESSVRPDPEIDDARRKYFCLTSYGRAVLESEVGAILMVVGGVLKDQAAQVSGVEHHHVVEHLAT